MNIISCQILKYKIFVRTISNIYHISSLHRVRETPLDADPRIVGDDLGDVGLSQLVAEAHIQHPQCGQPGQQITYSCQTNISVSQDVQLLQL